MKTKKLRKITIYLLIITPLLLIYCSSNQEDKRDLTNKDVFTKGFPKTLAFRNDFFGLKEGYDLWESNYLNFNSITKKYLREEVDIDPVIAEYANKFAENHPERLMLLHLNGEGMSIEDKEIHQAFFPGHWIYEEGTFLSEDIDENQNILKVKSANLFSEKAYIVHGDGKAPDERLPHDLIIVEVDNEGNRLWNNSEYATIEKVDPETNILTVKRGQHFSNTRSFRKENTYIAPLAGGSWGGNLMWYYNLSSACPKDKNGKTCADIFLGLIENWYSKDGILKNIDGIGYDVNYFISDHKTWDCNNDGVADKGIVEGKNIWRDGDWKFLQDLRKSFGPEFIITADGWRDEMQRAVGVLNGMESEGLCRPNDAYRQMSKTINQHTYWNMYNNAKYKFSYITSKIKNPVDVKISTQLHRMGIGLATCLGIAYNTVGQPESYGGSLNKPNWLGQPVSELNFTARQTPDLLNGAGVEMSADLINKFDFSEAEYRVDNKTFFIKGKSMKTTPYTNISIPGPEISLPQDGDLIVFFEAKAIDGYFDFKPTDRVPRKINIKINGTPSYNLPDETQNDINMKNDLGGFMGTPGFTPLSFYFRKVGKKDTPVKITLEVEEQGEFAIRNLIVHNAPYTMAREFENGVVLVNPSYDAYDFNLNKIFSGGEKYRRISVEKPVSGRLNSNFEEISAYNNGEKIVDADKITVPGLNALFLIKE